ncbi:MAG: Long-chain-fatty-acid--AMP ligase FadD26 [Candidatus Moanabacter tarae]|uniref:Long-chain-fatty-acid--AMP ligase FadD26 n=1 Tax=Candidatus Moanibacter tarae TaxID=2200854 RepID=A0A2Z4ACX5_9BACT|nr:MAG: Long-chain-fatty-acid--AMP ligase FadD26 [Candidatus Moanabacter tarae]|tara:strand:+ start:16528 stop:19413 length:2886 start_codon:yes stop_codon:yes gene_type:complete
MPLDESGKVDSDVSVETLLGLIDEIVAEINPGDSRRLPTEIDHNLDSVTGLDSLSKMELLSRIEETFKITLVEQSLIDAETPRDLLRVIESAGFQEGITTKVSVTPTNREVIEGNPTSAKTLTEVLKWHVNQHPERTLIQFYSDLGEGETISYGSLQNSALIIAESLRLRGVEINEPVAIILPTGAEYFYSFVGILYSGGVPVPLYPPARWRTLDDHIQRQESILRSCGARFLITSVEGSCFMENKKGHAGKLQHIFTVADLLLSKSPKVLPVITPKDTALLQYTSGSTGNPKGVVLTHSNLLNNVRAMGEAVDARSSDVFISWLPLYHDMGLIGAWMGSLYFGMKLVLMSPTAFLAKPQRWLWAIHRYRGTLSAAPNFAYDQTLRRIDDAHISGLDLSSWRVAFNGAEPVSAVTVEKFIGKFRNYGFKSETLTPVYGLAECCVGLAFPPLGRGVKRDQINRQSFQRTGIAMEENQTDAIPLVFVSNGLPLPGHEIRIVDTSGRELPERQEGRVQFRGPSATLGYYRNFSETGRLFDGDWRNTGDRGYIAQGEVYITGRVKDIIIKAGRNLYPYELEAAIGRHQDIITGNVAVFGSSDPISGLERLVAIAETRKKSERGLNILRSEVNLIVSELVGLIPDDLVLVPPRTVLKTSSGKVRRAANRAIYERKEQPKRRHISFIEDLRIRASLLKDEIGTKWNFLRSMLYATRCWILFGFMVPFIWFGVVANPIVSWRWTILKYIGRFLSALAGISLTISGLDRIPKNRPFIFVCNHASYIDGFILTTLLPFPVRFVAKSELWNNLLIGKFLSKIGSCSVERFDHQQGLKDFEVLASSSREETALLFFPEGSFSRMPGLLPFHLGAFVAAAEADVAIVPIAIRGTRSILRADSWFPRKGTVSVVVGDSIDPEKISAQNDNGRWNIAIKLRDNSRSWILRHCAEPELSHEQASIFAQRRKDRNSG